MTTRTRELQELYAYNRWANARMLDAAAELTEAELTRDLGSSFPSIRATLSHILAAEWIWVERWHGESPAELPAGWEDDMPLDDVRRRWSEVGQRQHAFLSALQEASLDRAIAYTNFAGEPMQSSLSGMLRHVANHSTYHRGQVVTMLRQLGKRPPSTDLILFYRLVSARA